MTDCATQQLCLNDYDAYGFDLDHTLAKYNLVEQMQLTYNSIWDVLIGEYGYSTDIRSDIKLHKDFVTKGLFIDSERGNIVKLSHAGKILKASHGSRMLTNEELVETYGEKLLWEHYEEARGAVTPLSDNATFAFWENYFNVPVVLIYAQLVDHIDKQDGGPRDSYLHVLSSHLHPSLQQVYRFEAYEDGIKEHEEVTFSDLKQHGVYSSGNHKDLEKFFTKITGVTKPKVVYFGDSLCSDAFPVKTWTDWDLVLVLEEMEAEGYHPEDNTHHYWEPDEKQRKIVREVNLAVDEEEEAYLLSQQWGSFFYHPEDDPQHNRHMNTFWGELITKYCDIAIPSIEYIAGLPLEHKFSRFLPSDDGNTDGFSPAKPKPLLQL